MGYRDKSTPLAIGKRIKLARERAGKKQTGLAIEIGLADGGSVWRYEHGQATPSGERLVLLARALGVSPEWIMHGEDPAVESEETKQAQATERAVREYLDSDPTAKIIPAKLIAILRGMRFDGVVPSANMIRALALAMLEDSAASVPPTRRSG